MSEPKIEVTASALHEVLSSLIGPPHMIRELIVIDNLDNKTGKKGAISMLIDEYNEWAKQQNEENNR